VTPQIHQKLGRGWALVALGAILAACGGSTPSATPVAATPTIAATVAAPTAAAATVAAPTVAAPTAVVVTAVPITAAPPTAAPPTAAPPTVVPTTAPTPAPTSSGKATVDLHFTGTRVIFATGTNGTCKLVTVDGVTKFGFEASSADYSAFGQSFALSETTTVGIKWVLDANLAYANDPDVVIKISANHHKVTLDQDLEPLSSNGGPLPGPQHVKGTISCSS
jgi:hypothetical protein